MYFKIPYLSPLLSLYHLPRYLFLACTSRYISLVNASRYLFLLSASSLADPSLPPSLPEDASQHHETRFASRPRMTSSPQGLQRVGAMDESWDCLRVGERADGNACEEIIF